MLKFQNRFKRTQHSRWLLQGTDSLNTHVQTQCPGGTIQTPGRLPGALPSSKQLPLDCTSPSGTPVFPHHSRDKVKFKNKFILRNALVFILRFKMVLWAVWYGEEAQWHPSPQTPGYPASAHGSSSQHRWTNGKERDQLEYFPQVKSQNHGNKVLQIGFGDSQEQVT